MFLAPRVLLQLCFGYRGVCAIPQPHKVGRGIEDAFFSHKYGVGVADGVGGYSKHGVNPADYPREVMSFTLEALQNAPSSSGVTALEALNYGWLRANESGGLGGCPVVLANVVDGRYASILNLGDCGIIVVRNKKLLYRSEVQQHFFNAPFQLPHDPPSCGEKSKIELQKGDIFLCASDGVLDNVELDDLVEHLCAVDADGCARVAEAIGKHSSVNIEDRTYMSPFARHASAAGFRYEGGKADDVTALVARVTEEIEEECTCPSSISSLFP